MLAINVDSFYKSAHGYAIEQRILANLGCDLELHTFSSESAICSGAQLAEILIVEHPSTPITRQIMTSLPKCKLVVKVAVGIDNIDIPAATDSGIVVAHIPDFCTEEVSDHAVALLLACARRIPVFDRHVRSGGWNEIRLDAPIHRLQSQTVGLVGFGRIARRVAEKLKGWGMRLIACDPGVEDVVFRAHAVESVSLESLLQQADYVSLHVALSEATHHLIGEREFALMQNHSFLINTSRGPIIDEDCMIEALRSGQIAGAAIDVAAEEPPDKTSPLRTLPNVLMSPHFGAQSAEALVHLRRTFLESVAAFIDGFAPPYVVNQSAVNRQGLRPHIEWPIKKFTV
ncbi:MAG: C-terminal binding protein [Acidobacteria bacterium]|nr:C-terminal binding protein [Acidobacteriota bacterium]